MSIIAFPNGYFPYFNKGKPLYNGKIYIGIPDLDPTIPANQLAVTAIQESGDEIEIPQPIRTSSGGVPIYNGSPVTLSVPGEYSLSIQDSLGNQIYYSDRAFPITNTDDLNNTEERLLGVGSSLYKGSNGSYVQNGDTVPVGTTHLTVLINGKAEDVRLSSSVSGVVADLTETSATVGGVGVTLHRFVNGGYQATNSELLSITPLVGEQWFNTTDNSIHMGDGVKQGGHPVPRKDSVSIEFDSLDDLVSYSNHELGNKYSTGSNKWIVVTDRGVDLGSGLFAKSINENELHKSAMGFKFDGSDETERLRYWCEEIARGVPVVFPAGTVRISEQITAIVDPSNPVLKVNFNGMVIKPLASFSRPNATNYLVKFEDGIGDTQIPDSSATIENYQSDNDTITQESYITGDTPAGLSSLWIKGIKHIDVVNFSTNKTFYGAGLTATLYTTLNVTNIDVANGGGKYEPNADYVGVFDAAGDAINTNNAVGNASINIENITANASYAMGRAFLVSENGNTATKIKINVNNYDVDNFQRVFHLEDGGKSVVNAQNGNCKNFANLVFNLSQTDHVHKLSGRFEYSTTTANGAYGGISGLLNTQGNKENGDVYFEKSQILYSADCAERGSSYVQGGTIRIGSGVSILKTGSMDTHIGVEVVFGTNLAGIGFDYQNGGSLKKIGGKDSCPNKVNGYRSLGSGFKFGGGYESSNVFPYVEGGGLNPVSEYGDCEFEVTDNEQTLFEGVQHRRAFNGTRIKAPDSSYAFLDASAGNPFKQLDDVLLENVILDFNTHKDANRLVSRGLTQKVTAANPANWVMQEFDSQLVFVAYVMDSFHATMPDPGTVGTFKASVKVDANGTVTDIT